MPTPAPSEPRRFSLKDDTTFSGIRIHPSDREVDGGGYVDPGRRRLIPAHGFVYAAVAGSKEGEVAVPCEANFTVAERAAMREMVERIDRGG